MSPVVIFKVETPLRLIEVSDAAWRTLRRYRQRTIDSTEAGGVILGARRGPHFEIVAVTEPQRSDRRSRRSFVRRALAHRRLARKVWQESERAHGYLGEWHTHAEPLPTPSYTDSAGWRKLAKQLHEPLVHLIVGTHQIGAWFCDSSGLLFPAAPTACTSR